MRHSLNNVIASRVAARQSRRRFLNCFVSIRLLAITPGCDSIQLHTALATEQRSRWQEGLAVIGYLLGYLAIGEWAPDYKRWPIPEELARDGSGRLADVIPGDWDVICYVAPYSRMREQVRDGLRLANLPTKRVKNVPEFYLGENEYALVVLGIDQKPRILLIDNGRRKRFYFDLQGERFHNARASAIRRGHVAERIWHTRHRHDREPRLTTSGR